MKASDNSEFFREGQELFYTGHKKTPKHTNYTHHQKTHKPVREPLRLLCRTKHQRPRELYKDMKNWPFGAKQAWFGCYG